ncbi:MAG TPA: adenylate/guanylate cyclase domain-containing protein [Plantibacter sp.]|uniref:adenylate/guanylate cyclase domain-containing protein n=1 Tax=unclassified Plantibacter TaxID=2624265 RepID=UPI002B692D0E|nr:adenylate/guanylate cyclase domain-containing protein [Plantibacter sp.]
MTAEPTAPPIPSAPSSTVPSRGLGRGRIGRPGFSIQSKLLVMLLLVSVGASVVTGIVGYLSGSESLRQASFERLTELRESRAREITNYYQQTADSLVVYTRGTTVVDAMNGFHNAFHELEEQPVDPARAATVESFYTDTFAPALAERTGDAIEPAAFIPKTPAQTYLQSVYTPQDFDYDAAIQVDDAGDGSTWSAVHATYNDYFREIINRFGYEDALLIDDEGDVVYSAYKGPDLGTNVLTGPYKGGVLEDGFNAALRSNAVDYTGITDFERYQPSLNVPTQWIFSPVGQGGRVDGVMALQVPIEQINTIMTSDGDWKTDGLGDTGETYLAGPDELMRSTSRLLIEDPEAYLKQSVAAGTPPQDAQRAVDVAGTIEIQPTRTTSVERALAGETGTLIGPGYLGGENLTAYMPLEIDGLQWVLVARIDSAEAFAPVTDFTRNLIISVLAIIVVVSLLSLVLAQVFARPVRALVGAVRRVAAGDYSTEVPNTRRDEFGDLGMAFNDMSRSLRLKQELIDEQRAENEKLLLTLMPASVAKRYKEGEETISEVHQDVSVIFADLVGFDDLTRGLDSEHELSLLNGLVRSFDEAAERLGIEQVRTLREGYLASCGLIVPRVDNVRRTLDFALEMRAIVDRFNAQHKASLTLRVGVDAGIVTSGLVGRTSMAYDMWGDAVSLANRVQTVSGQPGIFVSQRVRDRMQDTVTFESAGTIETRDGEQTVWRVTSGTNA